jgi:hypothetical protein
MLAATGDDRVGVSGSAVSFTAPRFIGNTTLTDCLNGVRTMPPNDGVDPESDPIAVRIVQRALVDLGYLVSELEIDGLYQAQTTKAVARFKADRGISPSNGVVGPKTSKALDDEFQLGSLSPGSFAPLVAAGRLDDVVAGLLDLLQLIGSARAWCGDVAAFGRTELQANALAGIVRAARVSDLKAIVPAAQHADIDSVAAQLTAASAANGPFAMTTRFDDGGVTRSHIIYQDAFLDRAQPGDARHIGGMLSLAHELTHHRNRALVKRLRAEPVTPADYVDVGLATAFSTSPGGAPTAETRATFIEEIACRSVAWQVYQELVGIHAGEMLATGVIKQPAAVAALSTVPKRGQLFRAGIRFADLGASPNADDPLDDPQGVVFTASK